MESKQVTVKIDDRARLISALLALTSYPESAQARKKHGTHPHARATRRHLSSIADHPAVREMQRMLDQGVPLTAIYALSMTSTNNYPNWVSAEWARMLASFWQTADLRAFWETESIAWTTALRQLKEAFSRVDLIAFLRPFFGDINYHLNFEPNLGYPADQNVWIRLKDELVVIMPPPQAWGDSAPWAYKDDHALAYRAAISAYGALLLDDLMTANNTTFRALAGQPLPVSDKYAARYADWKACFTSIFNAALIALFLEETMGKIEARSYLQYMERVEGLTNLPMITEAFRTYIQAWKAGSATSFVAYLPQLLSQMQTAATT